LPDVVCPQCITAFHRPPRHTLKSIHGFFEKLTRDIEVDAELRALVAGWSENIRANAVSVGSEDPTRLRALLMQRYGAYAPFRVRRQERVHAT
jgi:hypothetical protein